MLFHHLAWTKTRLVTMAKLVPKFLFLLLCIMVALSASSQVTAGFTVSDTAGCIPVIVTFTNTSTGATSYIWDLGNGSPPSTDTNAAGSYTSAGTYTVTLTAISGSTSSTYKQTVRAYGPPTVNFFASRTNVCPGDPITFTSTSVSNSWGRLSYQWTFGDGSFDTATSPTYSYASPGAYNVILSATSGPKCKGVLLKTGYVNVETPPTAGFSAATTSFCKTPATVSFINTTSGTGPFSYVWTFGDGTSSPATSPTHTYAVSGSDNVKLSVTDAVGCKDSVTQFGYINIGSLTASFSSPSSVCQGLSATFRSTSSAHISSVWYFGDGSTSAGDTAVHTYAVTGTYTVKLVIFNGTCYDSVTHTIAVDKPSGTISTFQPCTPPSTINFSAVAPGCSCTADWDFGDHTTGSGTAITHTFATPILPDGPFPDTVTMILTDGAGCKDTLVSIDTPLNLQFVIGVDSGTQNGGCVPLVTHISGRAVATMDISVAHNPVAMYVPYPHPVTNYLWDFGDGSPSTTSPASWHTYSAVGVYSVTCTVTTANGCTTTGTYTIRVGTPQVASFTASPRHVCAGQPITYKSTSTNASLINRYQWMFADVHADDGTDSVTIHRPVLPYIADDRLVVYYNGCPSPPFLLTDTVDAANAALTNRYTCIPANGMVFGDSSVGDDTRLWQFGDGDTSTLRNPPAHLYPALSTYSVTLTTYNTSTGCRDTSSISVNLQRLSGNLALSPKSICRDLFDTAISTIRFTDSTFTMSSKWYVNGVFSYAHSLIPSPPAVTITDTIVPTIHVTGNIPIVSIVTDNHSCLDTFAANVLVAKPTGNFTFAPATGCGPLPVSFKDITTDVSGATVKNYLWSFGDGSTSSLGVPTTTHTYTSSGSYTIQEIVTDNVGCSDTFTALTNAVVHRPVAAFSASTTFVCIGQSISFNNTSTGSTGSYWIFGDGTTSTASLPVHVYKVPGTYTVKLAAIDGFGCTDTATKVGYISVYGNPKASFTMSDTFAVCPPLFVNFTNTSTGATSYHWSLGDGTFSTAKSPSDLYSTRSLFTIKLTAVNIAGCIDTAIGHASIFGYTGAFSYTPVSACAAIPVHFSATISGVTHIVWDFNDGSLSGSTLKDTISHVYVTPGEYIPTLLLIDSSGCTGFSKGADTIKVDTVVAGMHVAPSPVCQNSSVAFADSSTSFFSKSASWLWTFGSGATSTASAPAYTYSVSGVHTVTLSVTDSFGCKATTTRNITVNPQPATITGDTSLCTGQASKLSDTPTGGTWSSPGFGSIVSVGSSSGLVTGLSAGTATITYQLSTGCLQSKTVSDNAAPSAITGPTKICAGFTGSLSDTTSFGTWSSSATGVATINPLTGLVSGIAPGTATITYAMPAGCAVTTSLTVVASPLSIIGVTNLCAGSSYMFSDAISGGSWSSSNTAIATIDSATGVLSGVSSGLVNIKYSTSSTCSISKTVSVSPSPSVIDGPSEVCAGSAIVLSDTLGTGKWSTSATTVVTVAPFTGVVSGVKAGTATISYTVGFGCSATRTVTVNVLPVPITGITHVCAGLTTALSDGVAGGRWTTAGSSVATVDTGSGVVTGVSGGSATITYMLLTGCKTQANVTVTALPLAITGPSAVCQGASIALTDASSGGSWEPASGAVVNVGTSTGLVTGVSAGTATISYTNSGGCTALKTVTVNSLPFAITGNTHVCAGLITNLSDASPGGSWSSINTSVAGVSAGVVTGSSAGTTTITYTLTTGCNTTTVVTVDPLPLPISGLSGICVGSSITLSDRTVGGTWSSLSTSVGVIAGTGVVNGLSAGTATITYEMSSGCITTGIVTVNPLPAAISGTTQVCVGLTTTLSDTSPGGLWASSDNSIAVVAGGIVTGKLSGTATITYTLPTECRAIISVTVNPLPAAISGDKSICVGLSSALSDVGYGSWSSGNTLVATIDPSSGVVTGNTPGTAMITYTLATGCFTTAVIMINSLPSPITGNTTICQGATVTLSDATTGGTWSSSATIIASVDAGGNVTGVSSGIATLTYVSGPGCIALIAVTVDPLLAPITGTTSLCKGTTSLLSDITSGGSWSSGNNAIASIDQTGLLSGLSVGTTTVTYTVPNTCGTAYAKIVVNSLPDAGAISGTTPICSGLTTSLSETVTGGVWSGSNDNVATVSASGLLNAVESGTDTISYVVKNICGTAVAQWVVAVHQSPGVIHIATHPDTVLCTNTLFQNFGADEPEPAGIQYRWSADNASVYATAANGQYCLISFHSPGTGIVRLLAESAAFDCISTDSIKFSIGTAESPDPVVVYYTPEFVCKDNTAESYQWGYDDVVTLDSSLLAGEVNQNYYNESPDFKHRNYWVMTYHNGCLQKTYYNAPEQINYQGGKSEIEILLYPNPAESKINIDVKGINAGDIITVKVFDMIGREVGGGMVSGGTGSIDVSGYSPAAYMVLFSRDGVKIGSATFIKN